MQRPLRRRHRLSPAGRRRTQRLPFIEALECRRLLFGSPVASLQSLAREDLVWPVPDIRLPQLVALDFDGANNAQYDGPVSVNNIDIPSYRAPLALAGKELELRAQVLETINSRFAGTGVQFVDLSDQSLAQPYSTIYIGGDGTPFHAFGQFYGLAEKIDYGNQDPADEAFVFTDYLYASLNPSSLEATVQATSEIIIHETLHLLGAAHADEATESTEDYNPLNAVAAEVSDHFKTPSTIPDAPIYANRVFLAPSGSNGRHLGVDIDLPEGTPIRAGVDGVIVAYTPSPGYGTLVVAIEVNLGQAFTFINAQGNSVTTSKVLWILGHLRKTSGFNSGTSLAWRVGQTVTPEDIVGYIQRHEEKQKESDVDPNGDGDEHLHIGLRLQSTSQAKAIDGGKWLRGYEGSTDFGKYFADPLSVIQTPDRTRPIVLTPQAPASVNAGSKAKFTWNARDDRQLSHVALFLTNANGTAPVDTTNLVANGNSQGFVAKIDAPSASSNWYGEYEWTVPAALAGRNYRMRAIAVDRSGLPSGDKNRQPDASELTGVFTVNASALPRVQINDVTQAEGHTGTSIMSFTVSLDKTATQPVTIRYRTVAVTANEDDFNAVASNTVTIATGNSSATVAINVRTDRVVEENDTFDVELLEVVTDNAVIFDARGRGTITNDDQPLRLGVSIEGIEVTESDSDNDVTARLRILLTHPAPDPVSVEWYTVDGTASSIAQDYFTAGSSVQFQKGDQFVYANIRIRGDAVPELLEEFYVRLRNPTGNLRIDNASAPIRIVDNDGAALSIADAEMIEGNAGQRNMAFTVSLNKAVSQEVRVDFETQNGFALKNQDFTHTTGTLVFPPNSRQQTINVPILGDTTVEADELFRVALRNPVNAALLPGDSRASGMILNDDSLAIPQISVRETTIVEGDSGSKVAVITLQLSSLTAQTVRVRVRTGDSSALAGQDYSAISQDMVILPYRSRVTIEIPILGDLAPETEEFFRVQLSNPENATLAATTAKVIIQDNDNVQFVFQSASFTEGDTVNATRSITVSLSKPSTVPISVKYQTGSGGTATAASDYQATSGTLTFAPNQTFRTFPVTLLADTFFESDEKFFIDFFEPVNATFGDREFVEVTIENDDQSQLPAIAVADASITEGNNGSRYVDFAVSLTRPATQVVSVAYRTSQGTATVGSDFQAIEGTLFFTVGQTRQTLSVAVLGDLDNEADESFFLTFSAPQNAVLSDAVARGLILNDDQSAPPSIKISSPTVVEGNDSQRQVRFDVTLSRPAQQKVIVNFQTVDGSATAGTDYVDRLGGLTFDPNEIRKEILVTVNGDTIFESDETFFMQLSQPVNATLEEEMGRAVILNDDSRIVPELTVQGSSTAEGNSGSRDLQFVVSLSQPSQVPVTVDYETLDGTATSALDYVPAQGSLLFIPGETFKLIKVAVRGDNANEADEYLWLTLKSPDNATLLTSRGEGNIINDDAGAGAIQGTVFLDQDTDSQKESGENGLSNILVYLDLDRDGQLDSGEPTQLTDSDGRYTFAGVAAGSYQVRQQLASGWAQSLPCGTPGLKQLTDNTSNDLNVDIDGCKIVWEQQTGAISEIWLSENGSLQTLTPFPLQTTGTGAPKVDRGQVVFGLVNGTNNQIFLHSNENTIQLTSNTTQSSERPQIDGGQAAWMTWSASTNLYEVWLYDGRVERQISTNDGVSDTAPVLKDGKVAWVHGSGAAADIHYFDGNTVRALTTNPLQDASPQLDGQMVVWEGWDGNDWEIFLFDGTNTVQLTQNDFDDTTPQISAGQITWRGRHNKADSETFLYNGSTIIQLTNNTTGDLDQQIDNGRVVWIGVDPITNNSDIFIYDASGIRNLSNHPGNEASPKISGNRVAWSTFVGSDYEVFEYVLDSSNWVQVRSGQTTANVDFGTYTLLQITGQKFNDLNGDAVRTDGEPGLAGWSIDLDLGADGTVDATTTTDDDGNYLFADIQPGPFQVTMHPQANWLSTTLDSASNSEGPGGGLEGIFEFGAFLPVVLAGQVFNDLNGDGSLNDGELPLQDWLIDLDLDSNGTIDQTTQSGVDGRYSFLNVGPGQHAISQRPQANWATTTSSLFNVQAISGQAEATLDFGNNAYPTISSIADQFLLEDQPSAQLNFTVGDRETASAALSISATSSNVALVPNQQVNLTGSGSQRAVVVSPALNQSGLSVITLTVSDGTRTSSTSFTVTVQAVNDPPTIDALADRTIVEDASSQIIELSGISAGGGEEQSLKVIVTNNNASLFEAPTWQYSSPATSGQLTLKSRPDAHGTAVIEVTVRDAGLDGVADNSDDGLVTKSFTVNVQAVNDPPTIDTLADLTIDEDASPQLIELAGISAGGGEDQLLNVVVTSNNANLFEAPTWQYSSPATSGQLTLEPRADAYGTAVIEVTVRDAGLDGVADNGDDALVTKSFTVTVQAANDPPTIDSLADLAIDEDASSQMIELAGIAAGGGEDQSLSVVVTSNNANLFEAPTWQYSSPATSGQLTLKPRANAYGTAVIEVTVRDVGLDGVADNSDDALVTKSFTVTVQAANDPPTIDSLADLAIDEDASSQMIELAGISAGGGEDQSLSVVVTSNNANLFEAPTWQYISPATSGQLTLKPRANAYGTAVIEVTVRDTGLDGVADNSDDALVIKLFTVTVQAINDAPTIDALADLAIDEDANSQIIELTGISAGSGEDQLLSVVVTSNNASLFEAPAWQYSSPATSGQLTLKPRPDAYGTAVIEVTVRDAGLDGVADNTDDGLVTKAFTVTVQLANDPPTIDALADLTIDEDASSQIIELSGISAGGGEDQLLNVVVTSNNANLFEALTWQYSSPAISGHLTFKPRGNAYGTAVIEVSVRDAGPDGVADNSDDASVTKSFTLTVQPVNDAPAIDVLEDLTLLEDAPPVTLELRVVDIETAKNQLVLVAASSNTQVLPDPVLNFDGQTGQWALTVVSAANQFGVATVTVRVTDEAGQTSETTFTVTVQRAGQWHNGRLSEDVNNDNLVTPLDALLIINELNTAGPRSLPFVNENLNYFLDVNDDGFLSAVDALLVINFLNTRRTAREGESPDEARVSWQITFVDDLPLNRRALALAFRNTNRP